MYLQRVRCLSSAVTVVPAGGGERWRAYSGRLVMARDLLGRPPLRASELPPNQVSLYAGEARAVVCPGCSRWQVPHDGGLCHHTTDIDSKTTCREVGRRVWFD